MNAGDTASRPAKRLDLRLYAIVDPQNAGSHGLIDLARAVAAGGATLVQLRDKVNDTGRMVEEARALKAALAPFGVPLIINDRVDVALAAGADGVHVGQDDMAAEDARRLLGPGPLIGLSIRTPEQAAAACGPGGCDSAEITDTPSAPAAITGPALAAVIPAMPQAGKLPTRPRSTLMTSLNPSTPIGDLPLALDTVL